jgi:hypothetical protein
MMPMIPPASREEVATPPERPRIVPLKVMAAMPEYADTFTEHALRHLVADAEDRYSSKGHKVAGNGLRPAIIRLGRRVLLDLDAFDAWLLRHRAGDHEALRVERKGRSQRARQ